MPVSIFRAGVFGNGDTLCDAEVAWKRNIRRMMSAVQHVADVIEDKNCTYLDHARAMAKLIACHDAAVDPGQLTKWPDLPQTITYLDRMESSYGSKHN